MDRLKEFINSLSNEDREIYEKFEQELNDKKITYFNNILLGDEVYVVNPILSYFWSLKNDYQIKRTILKGTVISTVLLMVSDDYYFETMIFDENERKIQYKTLDEAKKGHDLIVNEIMNSLNTNAN